VNLLVNVKTWTRGTIYDPGQHFRERLRRQCPCCGYAGHFVSSGKYRVEAFRCPNCEARPRDRQIALMLREANEDLGGKSILHFAPEWPLFRALKNEPGYVGGDIIKRPNANAVVDITKIAFPDEHFDVLICNHVLEHVPAEVTAIDECIRVLKPDGYALFSVPIERGRATTWDPPPGTPAKEVERICGWDHVRLYGEDFAERLRSRGFTVTPVTYPAGIRMNHALYDEDIFYATKNGTTWQGRR
jgi:SAM-dependent methyltransferase